MIKLLNSFYSKLALSVLASFILVGVLLLLLSQYTASRYQQEVEQKLHLGLAEHLVHDNPLFHQGSLNQQAIKHAFHTMMILGPSFEFYILDPQGKVLTYSAEESKIKRRQIDLAPLKEFISGSMNLPVVGDDPRSEGRQKIFSVAPIEENGQLQGYLYIIIGGEIYDNVSALLRNSQINTLSAFGILLTLAFTLLLILIIFALLTRPLRLLARDITTLQKKGFAEGVMPQATWKANSSDEIQKLGTAFNAMAGTLNQQYQKVQSMDQLRRELISYVSHDLRTPLAALQGYLETWQLKHKQLSDEESQKLIQVALDNACKTSVLVEQLFELAHLESDNFTLTQEPVALAELVQDVMQKLALSAEQKQVRLELTPKDPTLMAVADIQRIERVFTNLIDNAIRHCETGDLVKVNIQPTESKSLHVTVSDTGSGIPQEDLPHIFEPHFRASNSAKGNRMHSGLGLAITKRIVELHKSRIEVSSEKGQGTEFRFALAAA